MEERDYSGGTNVTRGRVETISPVTQREANVARAATGRQRTVARTVRRHRERCYAALARAARGSITGRG
jgi:hypothetical protein